MATAFVPSVLSFVNFVSFVVHILQLEVAGWPGLDQREAPVESRSTLNASAGWGKPGFREDAPTPATLPLF